MGWVGGAFASWFVWITFKLRLTIQGMDQQVELRAN
jgi:hypothetical protein